MIVQCLQFFEMFPSLKKKLSKLFVTRIKSDQMMVNTKSFWPSGNRNIISKSFLFAPQTVSFHFHFQSVTRLAGTSFWQRDSVKMFSSDQHCPGCCLTDGVWCFFWLNPAPLLWTRSACIDPEILWQLSLFENTIWWPLTQRKPIGSLSSHWLWKRCLLWLRTYLDEGFV